MEGLKNKNIKRKRSHYIRESEDETGIGDETDTEDKIDNKRSKKDMFIPEHMCIYCLVKRELWIVYCFAFGIIVVIKYMYGKEPTEDLEYGQRWDSQIINNSYSMAVNSSQPQKYVKVDSCTQTPPMAQLNEKTLKLANESFGNFVAYELSNITPIKRRYVMHQIMYFFENDGCEP